MYMLVQKDLVLVGQQNRGVVMKYKVVIDSTVYLKEDFIKENNIGVASLNVIEGMNSYREVDTEVAFIFSEQDKGKSWTTSQPAPGEFLNLYEEALEQGYDFIFEIGLSKDISGTYQSAMLAKNMLDHPDKVHVFDTQLCAYGTEMVALELMNLIKQDLDKEEIISRMESMIKNSDQMFTVENLFSLTKGGRLSVARAAIGTVLRVKPIIRVIDGKLKLAHSERTYKKVHQYMIDAMKESTQGYKRLVVYITNQFSPDSGEQIKSDILAAFPDAQITYTDYLGPVFSIHVGRKGYGISWTHE